MNFRGIVHARIDDRLIHGQVAVFWCNYLGVSRIMVANVTPEELEAFLELNRRGIRLTAKLVPDSQEEDLMEYLKKAGGPGFEQVPRCEGGKE